MQLRGQRLSRRQAQFFFCLIQLRLHASPKQETERMGVSRVEVRLFSFFGGLGSHYVSSNLLLFNLLDLCPVGCRLSLVIGLPARERGRLRSSLFQPCRTSGARTECSVSWSYPPPATQRMIIKQHEWYDTDV